MFPTRDDVWGLVLNEAAACGLPIIASAVAGGTIELVADGASGWSVEPTPEGIAAALTHLHALTQTEWMRFSKESRRLAERQSVERAIAGFVEAIRCADRGGNRPAADPTAVKADLATAARAIRRRHGFTATRKAAKAQALDPLGSLRVIEGQASKAANRAPELHPRRRLRRSECRVLQVRSRRSRSCHSTRITRRKSSSGCTSCLYGFMAGVISGGHPR